MERPANPTITRRQHAHLARDLLGQFPTLDDAARVCRVSRARLSDYANEFAREPRWMPVDVLADLEAACGQPIYSAALLAALNQPSPTETLEDALCDLTEEIAHLQHDGRHMPATPRGKAALATDARAALRKLEGLLVLIEADNSSTARILAGPGSGRMA